MGIYNIVLLLGLLIYSPVILWRMVTRGDYLGCLAEKLGLWTEGFKERFREGEIVWFHAVSVGETEALVPLVKAFHEAHVTCKLVFSTATETGQQLAKDRLGEIAEIFYFPLDFSFSMRRLISIIAPRLIVLAETELWPNFLKEVSKKRIPLLIVNGRISDRSFKGYRLFKFFFKPLLASISLFSMQSELDKTRIIGIGAKKERVRIGYNLKFDRKFPEFSETELSELKKSIGFPACAPVLTAGSTHPGEEEIILRVYEELDFPELRLIMVPRKPHRAAEIKKLVQAQGLSCRLRSISGEDGAMVVIVDTIGELAGFYAASDAVFVGGSLVNKGGQNILEPAAYAKPVLFGPHMQNFRDIVRLLKGNGGIQVTSGEEMKAELNRLLKNPAYRKATGEKAREVMVRNRGAVVKNLRFMEELLLKKKRENEDS